MNFVISYSQLYFILSSFSFIKNREKCIAHHWVLFDL
nr:MAG TPA: hypothetical protein [Caudoviricetes sp.]